MDINYIRSICKDENIFITQHALLRLRQRNISYRDIKYIIKNGAVIEEYPEDYPYPSCLIFGITEKEFPLHVVVGIKENELWIITAYYPDRQKWNNDFKTRRSK